MNYYELFRTKYTRIHLRESSSIFKSWAGFGTVFETGESAVYFVLTSKQGRQQLSSISQLYNDILSYEKLGQRLDIFPVQINKFEE